MSHTNPDCEHCQVRNLNPMRNLSPDQLQELSSCKLAHGYKPGQVIFYEGNRPFGVYCLEKGKVKLTKYTPDGKSYIVRLAKAGDLLGYRSFLTNEPYSATAEVIEEATICFLDRNLFLQSLRKNPSFALEMLEQMGNDLKQAEDKARDMAYKSVPERLAELLLSLKESYGEETSDGIKLDIRLTREELASMLGTTIETTVRNLTRFKEKELISFDKKNIVLRNIRGLAEFLPQL
ncbi:transcriptional regulator [bacterium (Candidatus Blackallbacteria) CG17_big_fil_post_rev_8_21_14_2_50_48_46]|uniref:Transcriptional regulator n=1 Tax=bacterium (Candidatus Blackallbacteria) CG17_big_fil_post_rev_8_21_14_2_50_48_46 TaxID=2014261 RepID=A0A2M7G1Q3_9BACT|nr:MAG: transcriptional regulator [bacterium (Candidatus Blackallbacteria) CG18_big_fil_WC_8_21_14_2_50_49_26]PIW15665.1 MAG: transcriptional regulator [bacterium (Candidatus Blackallbacteria) CG17_big_fil_post_rev_8_21_14_2_50_48_46]PIW47308.1 MAG: transcriptional regulator [bacterium (Candidatus Blackallbacteria) CG13_big_fil_rev_8_21_14_2_50_49_14]